MIKSSFLILTLIFALVLANSSCSSYPTDKYLEENFNANRTYFEKLVSMIQDDKKVISIGKSREILDINYQPNKNVISRERLDDYISLLNKINALSIRLHTGNNNDRTNFSSIQIFVWDSRSWSIVGGGNSKSYLFTYDKPERIVESPDEIKSKGGDASHYKKLSENWYLFLDIW